MSPEEMARKSVVYLESTIPSFLTSKISPQIVTAAKQLTTREWWEQSRHRYHLVVSQFVWDEIAVGDSEASHRRCEVIQGLDELEINEEVVELYKKLLDSGLFPKKKSSGCRTCGGMFCLRGRYSVNMELYPFSQRGCVARFAKPSGWLGISNAVDLYTFRD
jgi:hypothetical protein